MEKEDFELFASEYFFISEASIDGFRISVDYFYLEYLIETATQIVEEYDEKLNELIESCIKSPSFKAFFPKSDALEIKAKLNKPMICLDKRYGYLSYRNHEFDPHHIIYIGFKGSLEPPYSVNVN